MSEEENPYFPGAPAPITAFPCSEEGVRQTHGEMPVDAQSFTRKISQCKNCRGMCCYHGAHLNDEQAEVVRELAKSEREFFASMQIELPEEVVVDGYWRGEPSGLKTAVKQWDNREQVPGYPEHWDNTACVFLNPDGYCGLQALSVERGKHPWFYKPFPCWLHPLAVPEEQPICVWGEDNDPSVYEDYAGFNTVTWCGRTDECGSPAYMTLHYEIEFLGHMLGRNLHAEIREGLGLPEEA